MLTLNKDNARLTSEDAINFTFATENAAGILKLEGRAPALLTWENYTGDVETLTSAVYALTKFAHEEMQIQTITGVLQPEDKYLVAAYTHNGYERQADGTLLHTKQATKEEVDFHPAEGMKVLYLAGGCFWGTERAFRVLRGVTDTTSGYANGHTPNPTYAEICQNETGYRETVRVVYDPQILTLDTLLRAYFMITDPTHENQQGGDIGTQYQSGIYWRDPADAPAITSFLEAEAKKYDTFFVEAKPLQCFYEAEEYHQDYQEKFPDGYCHVSRVELEKIKALNAE